MNDDLRKKIEAAYKSLGGGNISQDTLLERIASQEKPNLVRRRDKAHFNKRFLLLGVYRG